MNLLEQLDLTGIYGRSVTYQIYTILLLGIGVNESRNFLTKVPFPKVTWYYTAFQQHEFQQHLLSVFDDMEETMNSYLKKSKEQIDYYNIHKEYIYVKKRILTSFLENEKKNLDNHFQKRVSSILTTVRSLENGNIKRTLAEITENSLNKVLEKINDPSQNQDIIDSSFESAIEGLKNGKMEYKGDKVVPLFTQELKNQSKHLENLTPEEEDKLFSLTKEQRKYVAAIDNRAKVDYLSKVPEVSTILKSTEVYENIIKKMKNRVESAIKI
jgi:hypothetical protein